MNYKALLKSLAIATTSIFAFGSLSTPAKADKGMWILSELNKQNIEAMRQLGFKLSIDSLYNLDKPSITNSVVIFGGGCTGVTVSNTGLVFTNHHCGFDAIQSQSSVDHDYLRDGFVSKNYKEELPIDGLEVKYLNAIEDVTSEIMKGVSDVASMQNFNAIQSRIADMEKSFSEKAKANNQEIIVVPFYQYNKFYRITYDVFKDVRMVFAPPSSLGKFGGDTDNWVWPRQTADFSVFRVYASKDNKPAAYSKDNKPYQPKYFATVSTAGVKENSFAMTIGFPGSTERYIPSWGIENTMYSENEARIYVRGKKQDIWKEAMNADQATRIKYASKYARSSNYWKNSIGMNRGLKKLNVLGRKEKEENEFQKWADKPANKNTYGNLLRDIKENYKSTSIAERDYTYLKETLYSGSELYKFSNLLAKLANSDMPLAEKEKELKNFYKDFSLELDKRTLSSMIDIAINKINNESVTEAIKNAVNTYPTKNAYLNEIYKNSLISDEAKALKVLKDGKLSEYLGKDKSFEFAQMLHFAMLELAAPFRDKKILLKEQLRLYFKGRKLMNPNRQMPSDANFTMRMSYGSVKGYVPADGAWYNYYTTSNGLLEKNALGEADYYLLPSVKTALEKADWGRWKDAKTKKLHTAFISTNDITGGNSGSPVFDGNGRLIGLAFDGNWEAMSGDIEFEPELQRTISVDIRYVLWTIEKWGNASHLLKELKFK